MATRRHLLREAIDIAQHGLAVGHPIIRNTQLNYSYVLAKLGRKDEAARVKAESDVVRVDPNSDETSRSTNPLNKLLTRSCGLGKSETKLIPNFQDFGCSRTQSSQREDSQTTAGTAIRGRTSDVRGLRTGTRVLQQLQDVLTPAAQGHMARAGALLCEQQLIRGNCWIQAAC